MFTYMMLIMINRANQNTFLRAQENEKLLFHCAREKCPDF